MSDEADINTVIECKINASETIIYYRGFLYHSEVKESIMEPARYRDDDPPDDYNQNPILKYFSYNHLEDKFIDVSRPFCNLAYLMDYTLPNGPEKSTALRKLLEAKDAAVRTIVD